MGSGRWGQEEEGGRKEEIKVSEKAERQGKGGGKRGGENWKQREEIG